MKSYFTATKLVTIVSEIMSFRQLCIVFVFTFIISLLVYSTILGYLLFESANNNNLLVYALQLFQSVCVCAMLVITSWSIATKLCAQFSRSAILISNRAVLITGCDSGVGHQLAINCDKLGYHVFAGVLSVEESGAHRLRSVCSNRVFVLKMDVTNVDEVNAAIDCIRQSNLQLWAVINGAGLSVSTPIEWGHDLRELDKAFSVNVFGAARVIKLCLPLLRKSKGRVINITSLASRFTFPGITYYSMSKHALRSLSDGLRRELSEFGIHVITVESYYYRMPLTSSQANQKLLDNIWDETPKDIQIFYGGDSGRNIYVNQKKFQYSEAKTQSDQLIDALTKAITLIQPQTCYKCYGFISSIWLWVFCLFPDIIQDLLLHLFIKFITHSPNDSEG